MSIASLSIEVWRLGRRITSTPDTSARIRDSHLRLIRELEQLNVRIEDPFGTVYIEGMNAEIIDTPDGVDPARDDLIIADVLRPAIYVNGQCTVVPQIVLAKREQ